jgi:hypothetical protein
MSTTESFAPPTPQQVAVEPHDNAPVPAESSTPKEEKPEPAKKPDLDTAIKTAFEKSKAQAEAKKAEKPDPKAESTPAKPDPAQAAKSAETAEAKAERERAADGKFVSKEPKEPSASTAEPADGSGQDGKAQARPSEGRDYTKPPAHFLPRAKEGWGTTPPDVQGEVHRMVENYEKGLGEYKESHEKWKPLREFEQIAKQAGTTVPDYLKSVYAIDQLIRTNPVEGIKRVLASANITPEQYARHVLQQAQQQPPNPQAQQQTQLNQTIQQLQQQITQMQQRDQQREEEARLAQVAQRFIEPFKAEHPRYDELEGDIAFFLNSGKISSDLSEHERLEAAYDMAERINPAPKFAQSMEPGTQASVRQLDPAGKKSVTGSPTPGLSTTRAPGKEDAKDLDAILRRSLAKATAR